jgi:hypothetical protein
MMVEWKECFPKAHLVMWWYDLESLLEGDASFLVES